MTPPPATSPPQPRRYLLYPTAFLMAMAQGVFLAALPFAVRALGGQERAVGYVVGANFATYTVACVLALRWLDNFSPKRLVLFASFGIAAAFAFITLVTAWAAHSADLWRPIVLTGIGAAAAGAVMVTFWPPLMAWMTGAFEGPVLNRQLGKYNASWSSGLIAGPAIGGWLAGWGPHYALGAATLAMLATGLVALVCPAPAAAAKTPAETPVRTDAPGDAVLRMRPWRYMARVAMVVGYICVGLFRSVAALLFKDHLGLSEADYGHAVAVMCLANLLTYVAAGRIDRWHERLGLFIGAQLVLVASMVFFAVGMGAPAMFLAAVLVGVGQAFVTVSHMYYGVSGYGRRAGRMAIHEVLVALGLMIGPFAGGELVERVGVRAPYLFGIAVVVVGLLVQIGIKARLRRR